MTDPTTQSAPTIATLPSTVAAGGDSTLEGAPARPPNPHAASVEWLTKYYAQISDLAAPRGITEATHTIVCAAVNLAQQLAAVTATMYELGMPGVVAADPKTYPPEVQAIVQAHSNTLVRLRSMIKSRPDYSAARVVYGQALASVVPA